MGLDIYLYKCHVESVEQLKQFDDDIQKIEEGAWGDEDREYDSYSEEEKETIRKKSKELVSAYVAENSIPVFETGESFKWETRGEERIEIDSTRHPEHMFKIGYFRSSYNSGGLESRGRSLNLPTLHEVLGNEAREDYMVQPDWRKSLQLAKDARDAWKREETRLRGFDVFVESGNPFRGSPIASESDALNAVLEASERWESEDGGFDSYSNLEGVFFRDGVQVHGLFVGMKDSLGRSVPCVYVVTKSDESAIQWYVDAWDVVVETCEYVLSQPDPDKFFFHWSG